jgi:hypothetical protein
MPDTTTNGIPFLLGTDPAQDIASGTQAMAEFLDPIVMGIQAGSGLVPVPGGGGTGTLAVVFARPYSAVPVVLTSAGGVSRDNWADNITVNGFDLHSIKVSAGATNHTTHWVAVGSAVS